VSTWQATRALTLDQDHDQMILKMPTRFPASQFVVAGHLYLDLTPSLLTEGLPRPVSLSPSGPLHVSTGGAVPNVGPALWRLGHKVTLVAQFGDDWLGKVLPASAGASGVAARSAHCGWAEHKLQHCDGSPWSGPAFPALHGRECSIRLGRRTGRGSRQRDLAPPRCVSRRGRCEERKSDHLHVGVLVSMAKCSTADDLLRREARMEHAEVTATPGEGTWTASAAVGDLKLSLTEETKKPPGLPHGQRT